MVELMVAMAVGLIVMAALASLFKTGVNSTMLLGENASNVGALTVADIVAT